MLTGRVLAGHFILPTTLACCFSAVAVGAPDSTFFDFFLYFSETCRADEICYIVYFCTTYMIKVKYRNIAFSAVDAWMFF